MTAAENSDVEPNGAAVPSVVVAVMMSPTDPAKVCDAGVGTPPVTDTSTEETKVSPSPLPDPSATVLSKNSTR